MPERTINDVIFQFHDAKGILVDARRGETVDIPEGEDLIRGDKFGAFTEIPGEEPTPPANTKMPDIEIGWSQEQFKHWIDAAHTNEILAALDKVPAEERINVTEKLIEAEGSRSTSRKDLLDKLQKIIAPPAKTEATKTDDGPKLIAK